MPPYNNTYLTDDAAHMTRFQIDAVLGGLSIVFALVIAVVALIRRNHLPLKPHGQFFIFFKILFFIGVQSIIILLVPLDRLGNAITTILAPLFAIFPTVLR